MSDPVRKRMTSDEFIAWAMENDQRCELVAGEVVAMAPERVSHGRVKFRIARLLAEAVEAAGLPCEVFTDGMAVEVDAETVYEPDAWLRCGPPLPGDLVKATDPMVVVEVLSPSTRARDKAAKLADYFRIPSVRHYVILIAEVRTLIHHERNAAGAIATRIVQDGMLRLDPPGVELRELFG